MEMFIQLVIVCNYVYKMKEMITYNNALKV